MNRAGLLVALLVAGSAHAAPFWLSSFDLADTASTTAIDPYDWAQTIAGGAVDADIRIQTAATGSGRTHNATNGGAASSQWAGLVNVASGEQAYYSLAATGGPVLDRSLLAAGLAMHVPTGGQPSLSRDLFEFRMGATRGCYVRLNSDRTVSVFYETTAISFGTSATVFRVNACSGDPTIGCTVAGDCPSPQTCATCNTTTGAGCFWGTLELVQRNLPSATGDAVVCDLWINGRQEIISTVQPPAPSLGPVTALGIGATGTEATAMQVAFDDLVLSDTERAGFSYVDTLGPTTAGVPMQWTEDSCGSGTAYLKCVQDFVLTPFKLSGTGLAHSLRANKTGKQAMFSRWGSVPVLPSGAKFGVVQPTIVGRTGTEAGTYTLGVQVAQCADPGAACGLVSTELLRDFTFTSLPLLLTSPIFDAPPGGGAWTTGTLGELGVSTRTVAVGSGGQIRNAGMVTLLQIQRQDAPLPITLRDHNLGADDGQRWAYFLGDSLAIGTGASLCFGGPLVGTPCNQPTYCSWDPVNKSKPVGGCGSITAPNDAACQTCTARRLEFNNGSGYLCSSDAGCNLATCSGGFCTGDTDVPCSITPDCNLGTCETTATCEPSCGDPALGGFCPARVGWPLPVVGRVNADGLVVCGQDGLQSVGLAQPASWKDILYGEDSRCRLLSGALGRCNCSSNAQCQASSGGVCSKAAGWCSLNRGVPCTSDAQCTGGFDLCVGVCTASDVGYDACTQASDCLDVCVFPRPDYLVPHIGVNDAGQTFGDGALGVANAQCDNPPSNPTSGLCGNCSAAVPCVADATCSAVSPTSTCRGIRMQVAGGCTTAACSVATRRCWTAADCPVAGQSCTGGDPADVTPQGWCTCTADAQCLNNTLGNGQGYKCVSGMCRLKCGTDAHCGTFADVDCDTGAGVCVGRCTCPCDAKTCSTDQECPAFQVGFGGIQVVRTGASRCVAGRCADCGLSSCEADGWAHDRNWDRWLQGGHWMPERLKDMQRTLVAEAERVSDATVPLLIPSTLPENKSSTFGPQCRGVWATSTQYARRTRHALRADTRHFPFLIDTMPVLAPYPFAENFVDEVHYGAVGADRLGLEVATILQGLNACVTGTRETARPALYCQEADGDYLTTSCTKLQDCPANHNCRQRPCTVNDDTTAGCPGAPTCNLEG